MSKRTSAQQIAFGDFQTPAALAVECCHAAWRQFGAVDVVIEPTCGEGAFANAAMDVFRPKSLLAFEIHPPYLTTAKSRISSNGQTECRFHHEDFFTVDWHAHRADCDGKVLFLGNPPWVTNATLGAISESNFPPKSNTDRLRGIEAITGRSNFDISEAILLSLINVMRPGIDLLAMLVKTATARRVLATSWKRGSQFSHVSMRSLDAVKHFGVHVDACLLLLKPSDDPQGVTQVCVHSPDLDSSSHQVAFGWSDGQLVSDPVEAKATEHLCGGGTPDWRSGVKHDLASVLELIRRDGALFTRDGQSVDIETDRTFPLAKGSDVANRRNGDLHRRLLLPQSRLNESTDPLANALPKTFQYLSSHAQMFQARKSSIYRGRDQFAVFGVGDYTFAPWKVAICGLYKHLTFVVYGPTSGRPVVFDDTTYSLSFDSEERAVSTKRLLDSEPANRFFQARIFWDAKRPITARLLRSLDLRQVADELGELPAYDELFS